MTLVKVFLSILTALDISFQSLPVEELDVIEKRYPAPLSRLLAKSEKWSATQLKIFSTFLCGYTISYPSLIKRYTIDAGVIKGIDFGSSLQEDRLFLDELKRIFQHNCMVSEEKTSEEMPSDDFANFSVSTTRISKIAKTVTFSVVSQILKIVMALLASQNRKSSSYDPAASPKYIEELCNIETVQSLTDCLTSLQKFRLSEENTLVLKGRDIKSFGDTISRILDLLEELDPQGFNYPQSSYDE